MRKKIIILSLLVLLVLSGSLLTVKASAPFKTRTVNRFKEWVETQDAYEPIGQLRSFGEGETLKNPKDIFVDKQDYIYIADTGNRRIVILDDRFELVTTFGEGELNTPLGIFVRDEWIYVADYGTEDDLLSGRIHIYQFDRDNRSVQWFKSLGRPESRILEIDQFVFRPQKIAVDQNHTMYIVNEGSANGILLVNSDNRFLNFFAPNTVQGTIWDKILYLIYSRNPNVILKKKIPPAPYNVMLDDSGYIYTVTQSGTQRVSLGEVHVGEGIKKVNIGGVNFYPVDMISDEKFVDAWSGSVGNVYVATQSGFIYEYDNEGNLLFLFGGNGYGYDKLGLFSSISAIAVNTKGELIILDDNRNTVQIFKETNFSKKVHEALALYNDGNYVEALEYWEEVLRYNSMFDLAHKGIGLGKFLQEDYDRALEEFYIANEKQHYSDVFWEVRNIWLTENIGYLILAIVIFFVLIKLIQLTNRRFEYLTPVSNAINRIKQTHPFDELIYYFHFIRNPADACYEVKVRRRISVHTGFIFLLLLFILYILGILYTGFLFNPYVLERTSLVKEVLKISIPFFSFVIANHLISSLMEGEGTFRSIFINTTGALVPVFIIYPFIVFISNFLTYNEQFIYSFGLFIMLSWSLVMVFATVKENHNFTIRQTFVNLFLTILMMIIIIVVFIMIIILVSQVYGFISDVIKEVTIRG